MINFEKIILNIIENKTPCVFISPHLDDAIFSAGGLILELSGKTSVTIATVFTKAGVPPYTQSAKMHLRHSGYAAASAEDLISMRKQEDFRACKMAGANFQHLGFTDAMWRKKSIMSLIGKIFGNIFPEINHLYPFYKFNVISGKPTKGDSDTMKEIKDSLISLVSEFGNVVIFCPIGVGNHVDHIITRDVCAEIFPRAIFWTDFPYSLNFKPDYSFISKMSLSPFDWTKNLQIKKDLILEYRTQTKDIAPLLNDNLKDVLKETFYIAGNIIL